MSIYVALKYVVLAFGQRKNWVNIKMTGRRKQTRLPRIPREWPLYLSLSCKPYYYAKKNRQRCKLQNVF